MVQIAENPSFELRSAVHKAYSAAAERPAEQHAFPVGRILAEQLGYPTELLETLPVVSVEAFTGVSNVAVFAAIAARARVLDLGCGAGLDSLIAARRVGAGGLVIGIDFSESMLDAPVGLRAWPASTSRFAEVMRKDSPSTAHQLTWRLSMAFSI